jgi:tRNA dimethylallyltransferase
VSEPPPVPCLLGPTGSGKSEVATLLARRTRGEVIACDAFTVYRGMAILAAAPTPPPDVPHHLVGCLDPERSFSARQFVSEVERLVPAIRARGRLPWIVGGTALYLRAWLKGFGAPVGRDPGLRARLAAEAAATGSPALHARLAALDPERAAAVHPNDLRRVVRALEIIEATGRPASQQRGDWARPDRHAARLFGLRREPADLRQRIARRTEAMFLAGVLEEARALLARPLSPEAAEVLGLSTLEGVWTGRLDEAAAREEIARRTGRLAQKQMTFFRSFADVEWVDVLPDESPEAVATRVLARGHLPI